MTLFNSKNKCIIGNKVKEKKNAFIRVMVMKSFDHLLSLFHCLNTLLRKIIKHVSFRRIPLVISWVDGGG